MSSIAIILITLAAAVVNGALGYGFSSITVPIALLFLSNRVLNPALVPIEVALNAYVLWVNRAALPLVVRRVTAVAYVAAGLYSRESAALIPWILPSVVIGVPIGAFVIRHVKAETFRRVCMSFDAWVVGFGISTLLRDMRVVDSAAAFSVLGAVIVIDAWLLYRYFSGPVSHPVRR